MPLFVCFCVSCYCGGIRFQSLWLDSQFRWIWAAEYLTNEVNQCERDCKWKTKNLFWTILSLLPSATFEHFSEMSLLMFPFLLHQASSVWSAESATWHQHPGEDWLIDDYPCEELHALATAQLPGSVLLQQRVALLELLETNWDTG